LKQKVMKPKMFAKTGVAIMESTSAMNVDHIEKLWRILNFLLFTNKINQYVLNQT
jgi:hypothetical protein